MKLDPYLTPFMKINSKQTKGMNFTARKQSTDRTGILWNRRKKALHI
jgi:hypothetical protein